MNWKTRIGVDIPIITTEWGCWLFPKRSNQDLSRWLDHHVDLFEYHNIGSMWYTGIQNNQRAFGILNSETGWNQAVLDKLTGVKPAMPPKISQVINGEFFKPDHAWRLTSTKISREYIYGKRAFSGISMLKLNVPANAEGQLYLQTYKGNGGYMGAPGRTLLHLIKGQTYKISFIAASEDGKGRMKVRLSNAKSGHPIYDSTEAGKRWLNIGKDPRVYTMLYKHTDETEMDCLLYTSPSPRDGLLSRMPSSA